MIVRDCFHVWTFLLGWWSWSAVRIGARGRAVGTRSRMTPNSQLCEERTFVCSTFAGHFRFGCRRPRGGCGLEPGRPAPQDLPRSRRFVVQGHPSASRLSAAAREVPVRRAPSPWMRRVRPAGGGSAAGPSAEPRERCSAVRTSAASGNPLRRSERGEDLARGPAAFTVPPLRSATISVLGLPGDLLVDLGCDQWARLPRHRREPRRPSGRHHGRRPPSTRWCRRTKKQKNREQQSRDELRPGPGFKIRDHQGAYPAKSFSGPHSASRAGRA